MIEILQPGLLTTIQDSGRWGHEASGIPRSGFFDPFLAGIANRLVGNPLNAAVLEFAMIGPTLAFQRACTISIIGFGVDYRRNNDITPQFRAVAMQKGDVLQFNAIKGWFGYIAFSGGIVADPVLGSASTHFDAGIGKRLAKGDRLEIAQDRKRGWELVPEFWHFPEEPILNLVPAQHTDIFGQHEIHKITEQEYVISTKSNRMGIRLEGKTIEAPVLQRSVPALIGAVQVPGSGLPIILGPEGPTTGGYPQIAVLTRTSWTVIAGTLPGSSVRFDWIELKNARMVWHDRQKLFSTAAAWKAL